MIDFSKRVSNKTHNKKINPIEIYEKLDRTSTTGPLRPAQKRILEKWYEDKRNDKDLIIKLHTGAGKTLTGLLIALSYINSDEGPAVYICPNIYLMQQACAEAKKFGIPYCYTSNLKELPNEFIQGKSILITYVQKVFNGRSIFGIGNRSMNVGCIVLDDSHACIDSMVNACTIKISNKSLAYDEVLNIFESDLRNQGEGTYQDLINGNRNSIMAIPYWNWHTKASQITSILAKQTDDTDVIFAWPLLKDQIQDCFAYISNNGIEINPMCLPIHQFGIFNNAKHRILMSATTQEDTFFIKGLGLTASSVLNPLIDIEEKWSGEKMILIPDLICSLADSDEIIKIICTNSHNYGIVAVTPSFDKAKKYEKLGAVLANKSGEQGKMYSIISEFKDNYKDRIIVLANRYDGIDLPDDSCRILIIDTVPYYDSLSDRYEELCRSESEIIRIKTVQKIEQGLGRSVRGEKDYCVILVLGSDLIKYLRSIDNKRLFSAQTQKQIDIGFEIIEMAKEDREENEDNEDSKNLTQLKNKEISALFSTIGQCLDRDEGWKDFYSDNMNEICVSSDTQNKLYSILQKEREAYAAVLMRNYEEACSIIQQIVNECDNNAEKGWYLQIMAKFKYHLSQIDSNSLQIAAFKNNNQLLKPISGISYNKILYPIDDSRVKRILKNLSLYSQYSELNIQVEELLSNLSFGVESEKFESAVCKLGTFLGFVSQRPDKEIRKGPDNLWCIGINKYILIECKSEVLQGRKSISKGEAGQMEEHCAWFEKEYGDVRVTNVLIIPTNKLSNDAYFSHEVKVISKGNLEQLKVVIRSFAKEFISYNLNSLTTDTINTLLVAHKMHDDSFIERFLEDSIK